MIGNQICETRKSKGLTQEELAELSKVNLRTIQRIENSESEPRGKTLSLICSALNLDLESTLSLGKTKAQNDTASKVIHLSFLIIFNLMIMLLFGYLTIDGEANMNSRVAGILLSFFISLTIVIKTPQMAGQERLFKFGTGLLAYVVLALFTIGFPKGFTSGLFICITIALGVLFYGSWFDKK